MTHRQAAATPPPTALNKNFYCPLCSCIALIDRTPRYYAFVFKAPCSESFSFFSFLAPFSFFHVTVTVTVMSGGTAQLPLRSRSPRTCSLHWWEHLFSPKRRMPCFFPFRRPGPRFPNSPQSERGKYARRLASRKPGKHEKEKKTKRRPASPTTKTKTGVARSWAGGGGQESPKAAILVDLAPHLAVRPISPRG